ncbi:hypothetical protein ACUIA4_08735 [Vibrio parahaemolyticus]
MSNLIQVNSNDSSIKFIDFGHMRLTAFSGSRTYMIRAWSSLNGISFHYEREVTPSQLEHLAGFSDTEVALINDKATGFCFAVSTLYVYKAICELFSMPLNDNVIRAFEKVA